MPNQAKNVGVSCGAVTQATALQILLFINHCGKADLKIDFLGYGAPNKADHCKKMGEWGASKTEATGWNGEECIRREASLSIEPMHILLKWGCC